MDKPIDYANDILAPFVQSIGSALPGVAAGLLVIAASFTLAAFSRGLVRRLSAWVDTDRRPLVDLAGGTLRYILMAVGLITGLGTMGIDVSALIAGLGLTGFALGFALRDAVSNLISGVLILLYQPFGYGDTITVGGNSGFVIGINFRYTVLRAEGGTIINVPNSTMFNNSVSVASRSNEAA